MRRIETLEEQAVRVAKQQERPSRVAGLALQGQRKERLKAKAERRQAARRGKTPQALEEGAADG